MSHALAAHPTPETTRVRWDVHCKYGWGYVPKVGDELVVHRVTDFDGSTKTRLSGSESGVPLGEPIDGAELRDWVVRVVEVREGGRELTVVPI